MMWEAIQQADRLLFEKINGNWTNPLLDNVFPWWRYQNTWLPLYLFLFLFVLMNFGWRIWPWIVLVALTVTITDQMSSHLIKLWIQKPRPCQEAAMIGHVRLLIGGCPGNPGFTSSHAANHFGAAFLFFLTLKPVLNRWSWWWFFWAATVSYAQVYIGIHYPLDVIGGAVLGSIVGIGMATLYNKFIGLPPLLPKPYGFA